VVQGARAGFPAAEVEWPAPPVPAADQCEQRGVDTEPDPRSWTSSRSNGRQIHARREQDQTRARDGIGRKCHGVAQPGCDIFVLQHLHLPCTGTAAPIPRSGYPTVAENAPPASACQARLRPQIATRSRRRAARDLPSWFCSSAASQPQTRRKRRL